MADLGKDQEIYLPEAYDKSLEINMEDLFQYERGRYEDDFKKSGEIHRNKIVKLADCFRDILLINDYYSYKVEVAADKAFLAEKKETYLQDTQNIENNLDTFPIPFFYVTYKCIYNFFDPFTLVPENSQDCYGLCFAHKLRTLFEKSFLIERFLSYQFQHRYPNDLISYKLFLQAILRDHKDLLDTNIILAVEDWIENTQVLTKPTPSEMPDPFAVPEDELEDTSNTPSPSESDSFDHGTNTSILQKDEVMIESDIIDKLTEILAPYFPNNTSSELQEVLCGAIPKEKLAFKKSTQILASVFARLSDGDKMYGYKKDIAVWISERFQLLNPSTRKRTELDPTYLIRILSINPMDINKNKQIPLTGILG